MKIPLTTSFGIILLIFFFNRFLLPFGLQYSVLLTPIFIFVLYENKNLNTLKIPSILFIIYSLTHLYIGVVLKDFIISSVLMIAMILYLSVFYHYYKKSHYVDFIFEKLTQFNFVLTVIALVALATGKLVSMFWYLVPFTVGYKTIPRLKLFELEASHYSFALLPLFFYYLWKLMHRFDKKSFLLFLSLLLSLVLSFSLGVLLVVVISIVFVIIFHFNKMIRHRVIRRKLLSIALLSIFGLVFIYFLFPDNPLFFRLKGVLSGTDTSGRGRTYESFEIAWQVLQENNKYFGIGLGQFKIIGRDILINYYQFMNIPDIVRIPNIMAETLVVYGIIGFSLKLILQVFLFFKLRVKDNIFQLSLFVSLFVYQFTGSFIFNGLEYVFWIIAFYPKLDFFNTNKYFKL